MTTRHEINGNPISFMLAGRAVFTVESERGGRFTYKVSAKKDAQGVHFVKVLTGPSNTTDFTFIGTIFDGRRFVPGKRSTISASAPSVKGFGWVFGRLQAGADIPAKLYHEGRCGKCGRALTVPSSVESGFGPECAGR
jgi:hypothetical protein